jgi:hypothetical protein
MGMGNPAEPSVHLPGHVVQSLSFLKHLFPIAVLTLSLSLAPISDVSAQVFCETCAWGCTMTYESDLYEDMWCSCPTSSMCTPIDFCFSCYYSGLWLCVDYYNLCGYWLDAVFSVGCGCGGGGQA